MIKFNQLLSNKDFKLETIIISIMLTGLVFLSFIHIELKDKVSTGVLWLTASVIVYYAIETKRLRRVSDSQLKVQKEAMKNEFLPIIYPFGGMIQGQLLRLNLINKGKGIAKHIELTVDSKLKYKISSLSETLPEEDKFEWREDDISKITTNQNVKTITIEINYKDIYNRKYKTTGILFVRDEPEPGNRFQLDRSHWEFERKYNQK